MCGRLSQYHGIHDFVDALSMPYPLLNNVGDQPLERYNVAPTTRIASNACCISGSPAAIFSRRSSMLPS